MKTNLKSLGLLAALGKFFGLNGRGRSSTKHVPTNYRLPKEIQEQIIAKAQAKRERKLARPQGWYNG